MMTSSGLTLRAWGTVIMREWLWKLGKAAATFQGRIFPQMPFGSRSLAFKAFLITFDSPSGFATNPLRMRAGLNGNPIHAPAAPPLNARIRREVPSREMVSRLPRPCLS